MPDGNDANDLKVNRDGSKEWTRNGEPVDGPVPLVAQAMGAMTHALIAFCEEHKVLLHDVVVGIRTDDDDTDDNPNCIMGFIDGHDARGMTPLGEGAAPVMDALLFHVKEFGAANGIGIGVVNATDMIQGNDETTRN